jgi:poly(beta-D-mannuronate) lyase
MNLFERTTLPFWVLLVAALLVAAAPLLATAAPSTGASATLVPPPGFTAAVGSHRDSDEESVECAAVPKPLTGKLSPPSKYEGSDSARDDLNPKAEAEYEAAIAPVRELEKRVSSMVQHYLTSGRPEVLDCTLGWLHTWAQADALLGPAETHTGKSVRKWALASIASAYLRLQFSTSQPLAQHRERARRIESWLGDLGAMVVSEWKNQPLDKMNNHEYWAAWAVMATAVALNRRDFFDWALAQYRTGTGQIDAEGYLPNELKRDTRALSYHNYSLGPLAMIAAFAKANGADPAESRAAMQRLAERVLAGVDDPKMFQKKTGEKQTKEGIHEPSKFAWMEPYCWTFSCNGDITKRMAKMRPLKTYRLGGNVTELFATNATAGGSATGKKASSRAP